MGIQYLLFWEPRKGELLTSTWRGEGEILTLGATHEDNAPDINTVFTAFLENFFESILQRNTPNTLFEMALIQELGKSADDLKHEYPFLNDKNLPIEKTSGFSVIEPPDFAAFQHDIISTIKTHISYSDKPISLNFDKFYTLLSALPFHKQQKVKVFHAMPEPRALSNVSLSGTVLASLSSKRDKKKRIRYWVDTQAKEGETPNPSSSSYQLAESVINDLNHVSDRSLSIFRSYFLRDDFNRIQQILFFMNRDLNLSLEDTANEVLSMSKIIFIAKAMQQVITENYAKVKNHIMPDLFFGINQSITAILIKQNLDLGIDQVDINNAKLLYQQKADTFLEAFPPPPTITTLTTIHLINNIVTECMTLYEHFVKSLTEDQKLNCGWIFLGIRDFYEKIASFSDQPENKTTEVTESLSNLAAYLLGFINALPPEIQPNSEDVHQLQTRQNEFVNWVYGEQQRSYYQEQVASASRGGKRKLDTDAIGPAEEPKVSPTPTVLSASVPA